MTKRYYYTNPLAAAWMVKHFGMKFPWDNGKGIHSLNALCHWEHAPNRNQNRKFYIHPDSLHLLEPKISDMVSYSHPGSPECIEYGIIDEIQAAHPDGQSIFLKDSGDIKPEWVIDIIRRNGVGFHWPAFDEKKPVDEKP